MARRFEGWVERQIREAIERGEFDNLPGAGKPIPGIDGRDDPDWWVKGFLDREDLKMPLPASLALRKEAAEVDTALAELRSEETVRAYLEDLNERIRDSHRRRIDGPPLVIRLVDIEPAVSRWREARTQRSA